MTMLLKALSGLSLLASLKLAAATPSEVLAMDFPDPSILNDPNSGSWYTFATAGNGVNVQVASGPSSTGPWTWLDLDLLPDGNGDWAQDAGIWAPDVRYLSESGRFVMYYSAPYAEDTSFHCVGAATADTIEGPYTPTGDALACPISQGGAIDPSGYYDEATETRWLVYKIDGNSIGHGGSCNNGVAPIVSTPIMLQQLDLDGYTLVGDAVELLDRSDADGPLIEAPDLIRAGDGTYVIFFSSNCYSTTLYDVSYATSSSLTGPYTKSTEPLLVTGDYDLTAPGGATSAVGGGQMVFHANCDQGRCLFETSFEVDNGVVSIT